MTTTTVSNQAELLGALSRAGGGDKIVLKNGHYGSIKLTADFSSNVTIQAENRLGATISHVDLFGASKAAGRPAPRTSNLWESTSALLLSGSRWRSLPLRLDISTLPAARCPLSVTS